MDKFNNAVFKVIVAKLAQSIGFDSITTTSMDVLTTLFEKYLILLGTRTNHAAELRCSTTPDLSDIMFMMQTMKISIPDLTDFMQQMEPVETIKMTQYPVASSINLGFTYPNTLDQTKRLEHIPMHYPPLILHSKPELNKEGPKINTNERNRKSSFVIVGRHGHEDSSDDNDYFIPPNDAEESDDSTSSIVESRHLTKPEDIPIHAEGTAPSSEFKDFDEPEETYQPKQTLQIKQEPTNRNFLSPALRTSPVEVKLEKKNEHDWLLGGDEPDKFKPPSDMLTGTMSTPKFIKESSGLSRSLLSHHKTKTQDVHKKSEDEILKAKMEAAEKLIHSPPPFLSTSSHIEPKVPSPNVVTPKQSVASLRTPHKAKSSTAALKETPEIERLKQESKRTTLPYASPKSMDDAISAVISRVTEEAKRAEEEAELMKFSHLVESSSSEDSEPDVSKKVEEILQLKSRGLNEPKSSFNYPSSDNDSDGSYMKKTTPKESSKKEKRSPVHIYTSSSEEEIPVMPDKPAVVAPITLPIKKLDKPTSSLHKTHKKVDKQKVYESKPLFFPEDQSTIVKVKKKKHKPKTPVVENKSKSSVANTSISHKSSTKNKPENIRPSPVHPKEKTPKIKIKPKEHKKHKHISSSPHIEKLVLKKFKSGSAEVIKKEDVSPESPAPPPMPRSNLPVPKLSAAIPVLSVSMEKEKKKSKKEKKKKLKDKHPEKEKKRHKSIDVPSPKPDVVPKLTLCMGSNTKSFVVKRENSSPDEPFPPPAAKSIKLTKKSSPPESPESIYPPPIKRQVITQTLSSGPVVDKAGNKIWICPSCNEPDDGSPMIGCDTCDDWYHWPCVGITREPPDDQDWYCPRCTRKRNLAKMKPPKKKRKKTVEY